MIPTFLQHAAQCWTECCYRQGGICPPSNFSVWGHGEDSSFAIQAVVWDCRSWSRSLRLSFQFHQCPPPLHRLSLPLLMLLWLLMALLQLSISKEHALATKSWNSSEFVSAFFFSECWNACISVNCLLFRVILCRVVTYTEPDFTYTALFSLNACLVLHSCNYQC